MKKEIIERLVKVESEVVGKQLQGLAENQYEAIQGMSVNDEIYGQLEILELYWFRVPKAAFTILAYLLRNSEHNPPTHQEIKGLGPIVGKTHEDLIVKSIEILKDMRYMIQEDVFNLLLPLTILKDIKLSVPAKEVLKKMAEYNYHALKNTGYQPQLTLLSLLKSASGKDEYKPLIYKIAGMIFKPEFEGVEMTDEKTMTLKTGGLVASKALSDLRNDVITWLSESWEKASSTEKEEILLAIGEVASTPYRGGSDELDKLISEDINTLIEFYLSVLPRVGVRSVRIIERQLSWINKRFKEGILKLGELQKLIGANEEYQIFRILVGNDIYDEELERIGWKEAEGKRYAQIDRYIEGINEKTYEEWKGRIKQVIDTHNTSEDFGGFQFFRDFLFKLGEKKASYAFRLLDSGLVMNTQILSELLAGLWVGDQKKTREIMLGRIKNEESLKACIHALDRAGDLDLEILEKVLAKGKGSKDVIRALLYVLPRYFDKDSEQAAERKDLFVKAVKESSNLKDASWSRSVFYEEGSIFDTLEESDWQIMIANLVYAVRLDYHVQEVLIPFIDKSPELVIGLFKNRLTFSKKNRKVEVDGENKYYDAIPLHFDRLEAPLQKHKEVVIPTVLSWYLDRSISKYEVGNLLGALYSIVDLDSYLLDEKGNYTTDDKVIQSILYAYQGHLSLKSKFVQKYIKGNIKNEKNLNELMSLVSMSGGVVAGEYGFANHLRDKRSELKMEFKSKYMNEFITKYKVFLKGRIAYETKKSDEEIVLRKQKFNS